MEIGKSWDDTPWVWVIKFSRIPGAVTGKKERPILFSTSMVEAILEGRKTQTRRVVKPRPDDEEYYLMRYANGLLTIDYNQGKDNPVIKCPYGKPGDILWVRETFIELQWPVKFIYKADGHSASYDYKWSPSIHMPKAATRIWLRVEDVRVERLHAICDKDALAEGIHSNKTDLGFTIYRNYLGTYKDFISDCEYNYNGQTQSAPVASFCTLWKFING